VLTLRTNDAAIHRTRRYLQVLDIKGTKKWVYYNQCQCNEVDAVSRRHVREVDVDPNSYLYNHANNICTALALKLRALEPYNKWSHKELIMNTSSFKRGRYNNAYRKILTEGVDWNRFARAEAFVKFEKMPQLKADDGAPARLIQFRTYEYTYLLKSFLGPAWEILKTSDMVINTSGQKFREVFTSGLNYNETGELISNLWSRHHDAVALCLDHSFFDGHHHLFNLRLEHKFWNTFIQSKYLKRLLRLQERNFVRCKRSKSSYQSTATRLSGDWNTAAGNSIINYLMLQTIFPRASIVVNGDDSIVFISRKHLVEDFGLDCFDINTISSLIKQKFSLFGQITKVDRVSSILEQIEYCQCSPVLINGNYRMVRNPNRCLGRIQYTSHININVDTYLTSVGLCELSCNLGVPIMQSFAKKLVSMGNGQVSAGVLTDGLHYVPIDNHGCLSLEAQPIDLSSRSSFYLAFGITPEQQISFEKEFGDQRLLFDLNKWNRLSKTIAVNNQLQRR
jgi:hypothetical protein